jgi:acyl-coenzyme A thioesterase 9
MSLSLSLSLVRHAAGKAAQEARKSMRATSVYAAPPDELEMERIHRLLMAHDRNARGGLHLPADMVWMRDTTLASVVVAMPQDTNIHHKVFGGFLMRKALETAWAAARPFSRGSPTFVAMDDLTFEHPVEIGSLLRFTAEVNYTAGACSHRCRCWSPVHTPLRLPDAAVRYETV